MEAKDMKIAAQELPKCLGWGLRGNYTTVDGKILNVFFGVEHVIATI